MPPLSCGVDPGLDDVGASASATRTRNERCFGEPEPVGSVTLRLGGLRSAWCRPPAVTDANRWLFRFGRTMRSVSFHRQLFYAFQPQHHNVESARIRARVIGPTVGADRVPTRRADLYRNGPVDNRSVADLRLPLLYPQHHNLLSTWIPQLGSDPGETRAFQLVEPMWTGLVRILVAPLVPSPAWPQRVRIPSTTTNCPCGDHMCVSRRLQLVFRRRRTDLGRTHRQRRAATRAVPQFVIEIRRPNTTGCCRFECRRCATGGRCRRRSTAGPSCRGPRSALA